MGDDLGAGAGEVHAEAAAVRGFWFDALTDEERFAKDPALDARIRARFERTRHAIIRCGAAGWRDAPETLIAAVIVLDQFSRNMYRDSARAFEADALALSLSREAIAEKWDGGMPTLWKQFLYMPFMHSERTDVQAESLALFATLGDVRIMQFAVGHRDLVARFGRFPHRNAALGRPSSAEELDWLSQPGAGY